MKLQLHSELATCAAMSTIPTHKQALEHALAAKAKIESELVKIEKNIYDLESHYLAETAGSNIITGFRQSVTSSSSSRRGASAVDEYRAFSLSSVSSPVGSRAWPAALRSPAIAPGAPLFAGIPAKASGRSDGGSKSRSRSGSGIRKKPRLSGAAAAEKR